MERALCESCNTPQPRDWEAGHLCSHCGGTVRRDVRCAESADQHQSPRNIVGIEAVDEAQKIVGRKARPAFDAYRVADTARKLDMRAVDLSRAIADPQHVSRRRPPLLAEIGRAHV